MGWGRLKGRETTRGRNRHLSPRPRWRWRNKGARYREPLPPLSFGRTGTFSFPTFSSQLCLLPIAKPTARCHHVHDHHLAAGGIILGDREVELDPLLYIRRDALIIGHRELHVEERCVHPHPHTLHHLHTWMRLWSLVRSGSIQQVVWSRRGKERREGQFGHLSKKN